MRTNIALGICFASALILGCFCLFGHLSPFWATLNLWITWGFTADWLGRSYRFWSVDIKTLPMEARKGNLRLSGLALGINRASYVWLFAAAVLYFTR